MAWPSRTVQPGPLTAKRVLSGDVMQPPVGRTASKSIQREIFLTGESNETGWFMEFSRRKNSRSLRRSGIGRVPDHRLRDGVDTLQNLFGGVGVLDFQTECFIQGHDELECI